MDMTDSPLNRRWLERIGALLMREPEDREQLSSCCARPTSAICSTPTRCR